jgi:hypothetical protein
VVWGNNTFLALSLGRDGTGFCSGSSTKRKAVKLALSKCRKEDRRRIVLVFHTGVGRNLA